MKAADINRKVKDEKRRLEASRIYRATLTPLLAGDGPYAGGVYDEEGWYRRRDHAHEQAEAAVDQYLSGGVTPSTSQTANKPRAIQPDQAARNAALVESLGGIEKLLGKKAPEAAAPVPTKVPDEAFSWDDVMPEKKTDRTAPTKSDPSGWDEILSDLNANRR